MAGVVGEVHRIIMDKQAAINLITDTFNSSFNENRFRHFIRNLFNEFDENKNASWITGYIKDSFKDHVKKYKRVGKYKDIDGNKLDVVVVHLRKESALDSARTMQRNFIASYLKTRGEKDAAVVAYFTDNTDDWRFSYIQMEYRQEITESGKIKVKKEFTPRRYSFLVGKNEPNHTAQQQLFPILCDDQNNPSLSELEKAFSVEVVTKQFYQDYKGLFEKLTEELDRILEEDNKIKREFESKAIDTANFTKKLLGQIVFLYFLQKKGWLGVPKDEPWGKGNKKFLRTLFKKCIEKNSNFFNDYLEYLFYEALATTEGRTTIDLSYYQKFDCKIPFLNGGLFEPINDYNWQETDIHINNDLFAEIFDTLDQYNFTVREDEPLEKEVAVDPEMLGKVFENLLPGNLRKGQGAYYTPREIVHYMCQESLINYIDTAVNTGEISLAQEKPTQGKLFGESKAEQLGLKTTGYKSVIPKKHIEDFIHKGEFAIEHDTAKEEGTKSYKYQVPETIRKNAQLLDEKLKTIKICDPAIGSGAFPVGMMHEIVKARKVLETYLKAGKGLYEFKRHCIQESIYGVDIDPGAIEIAKLRLWLSLVVDEENYLDIKPLPNLDYKIMQGNSLIELLSTESLVSSIGHGRIKLVKELKKAKDELFNITIPTKKENKQCEIDILMKKLFEYDRDKQIKRLKDAILAVKSQRRLFEDDKDKKEDEKKIRIIESKIEEIKNIDVPGPTEHFEWHINYSEIFQAKGGFDVVIANPPYFNISTISKDFCCYLANHFEIIHTGYNDIVYYFIYLGIKLLSKTGCCALITSNYYLGNDYAKKLRNFLKDHVSTIINFKDYMVFDGVSIHTCISLFHKEVKSREVTFFEPVSEKKITLNNIESQIHSFSLKRTDLTDNWVIADRSNTVIIDKIKRNSVLLGNISTITKGATSGDRVIFTVLKSFAENSGFENELLKTSINSKDIKKYVLVDSGKYLIYTDNSTTIGNYPNIYKYLVKHKKKLSERNEVLKSMYPWYRLERPREKEIFDAREKLVVPYRAENNTFAYDNNQGFNDGGGSYTIAMKEGESTTIKYLLGILNSKLMNWFYRFIGKPKGKIREYFNRPLSLIPIKKISLTQQQPFVAFVDKILSITKSGDYLQDKFKQAKVKAIEAEIDQLVYKLYDLTPEEIKIVEGKDDNAD